MSGSASLPAALFVVTSFLLVSSAGGLRCYTDVEATKSKSVECGLNTGCVKIYIDSEEMLMKMHRSYLYPPDPNEPIQLPEQYRDNPVLLRGCFVLGVPDRCYNAKNGLSYCWCRSKDLCNAANRDQCASYTSLVVAVFVTSLLGRLMNS